jgi:hypothetical protein
MKKLALLVMVSIFLFTGCGMPDKAADMLPDTDVGMLNTASEITEALKMAENSTSNQEKVLSKEGQQQLSDLKYFLKKKEKEGLIKIDYYESDLDDWINAKSTDDSVFQQSDNIITGWNLLISDREKLLKLLDELDKFGYSGLGNMLDSQMSKETETNAAEYAGYGKNVVLSGMIFYVCDSDEYDIDDDADIVMSIALSTSKICYPKQLEYWIQNSITDGFYISNVSTGGYLQSIVLLSEQALNSPYDKQCVLYLKDGNIVQMDISIEESGWLSGLKSEKKDDGVQYSFFSDTEKNTMKNLLTDIGVSEEAGTQFLDEISSESASTGSVGSANWYLRENKGDNLQKNWLLRIQ